MKGNNQPILFNVAETNTATRELRLVLTGDASGGLRKKYIGSVSEAGVPIGLLKRLTPTGQLCLEGNNIAFRGARDDVGTATVIEEFQADFERPPWSVSLVKAHHEGLDEGLLGREWVEVKHRKEYVNSVVACPGNGYASERPRYWTLLTALGRHSGFAQYNATSKAARATIAR
ncbi:MAG TPA: hypothetical protein VN602_03955 [Gemmatimonadaceae bacterium]|nr:hypothetical protein [Gemmatimonadaceae bacterium]